MTVLTTIVLVSALAVSAAIPLPEHPRPDFERAEWSEGATNVLAGLKVNGFGKGFFEHEFDAAGEGTFYAEVSAKRKNAKDFPKTLVRDGKVTIRLEGDRGLAVYGPAFGRYPFGPHVK